MAPETPTPFWKKLVPKPSGSIPGGLFSQVAIGLIAIMAGAMIFSYQFCGAGGPPPAPSGEAQEPVAGGAGLGSRLSGLTNQQRRQKEHEERDRARRQQLQEQDTLAAGLGGAGVSPSAPGVAWMGSPSAAPDQQYQTDAEFKLMEQLRLEDIERRRRSLRSGAVVLTHRTARREEEDQPGPDRAGTPAAAPDPSTAVQDTLADFQSSLEAIAQAEGQNSPPEAPASGDPAPAPVAASGPNYADPTRTASPADPPGWERIYEGSFLEGVLVTQLSGEFTGPVLAMVSVPFYSADRQRVLVPRGTRAVGIASAVDGPNQTRLAVGFHRLVFPDGRWVELEFRGLDQAGDAALKDKVNRHYLSMFAAVGAVGVLSGLTLRGSHPYAGGMAGFRAGAGQAIAQSGMQILSRFLNRYPTITIRAGHRLRIWFTSDVLVPRQPPHGGRQ